MSTETTYIKTLLYYFVISQRNVLALEESLYVFIFYWFRHLTFFSTSAYFLNITLSSCLIWQVISFILPPNVYGCVYVWTTLGYIATLLWKCVRKLRTEKERSTVSSVCSLSCAKVKETGILIDKPKRDK